MSKFIFGVRSKTSANTKLSNGYTLYDWVMRKNCPPAFWARSISGEEIVTKDELEFLKNKNCKIALLFDELTENEVSSGNGKESAEKAIKAAQELGVPEDENIAIIAVIEDSWSVYNGWMINFAKELRSKGYMPGFIGNTDSSMNFNFDRHYSHFFEAGNNAICGATQPKINGEPAEWRPYAPSAVEVFDIQLWQTEEDKYKDINFAYIYACDDDTLNKMWKYSEKGE